MATAQPATTLIADVRRLIVQARARVAATANSTLTLLYWHIGHRIAQDVLKGARADYGQEILATLSREGDSAVSTVSRHFSGHDDALAMYRC
ncbi:MAG: DUF1016 N-terminal domain-containing protein [Burkholderiaceae bacterium]|nr:DUF1016 N-terminal domain-containing protein [Burkholderiaceae bacterium]